MKNERESNLATWYNGNLNGQISLKTISLTTKICSQCLTIEEDERVDCCPKEESIVAKRFLNFFKENFMMNYVPQSSPRSKPKIHKKKFRKTLIRSIEQSQNEEL